MGRIEEIINNTDLETAEICRQGIEYLNSSGTDEDYHVFADELIDALTQGYMEYEDKNNFLNDICYKSLKQILQSDRWGDKEIYMAFIALHDHNEKLVFRFIQEYVARRLADENGKVDCNRFVYTYLMLFKNAFPGFWVWLGEQFSFNRMAEKGITELCSAMELLYYSKNSDEIVECLIPLLTKYPDLYLIDELLACVYYGMGLWKNAIAYYERAWQDKDRPLIGYEDLVLFRLGYANSKIKDYKKSAHYYEEALKINPDTENVKNNLGLSYLNAKRFGDALRLFEECISETRDVPYCYNNKVRTLIEMGRAHEALEFAQTNAGRGKVSQDMVKKAETAVERGIFRSSATTVESGEGVSERIGVTIGVPKQQFSSERILEDELIARIERGMSTFGLHLRVYEQDGDFYGRQYPIKGGRIDILAVDDENNLYAIELKKDGGYGDVCEQVGNYIAWLRENKAKEGKKVFGIVCMNNPTEETIQTIKLHPDIRLFEYSIAYREITPVA